MARLPPCVRAACATSAAVRVASSRTCDRSASQRWASNPIAHGPRKAGPRGLDLRDGAAESLPFVDASFDVVTFENALHHVTEIGRAIEEAVRVARRAVVILDPWFDLSIPTQIVGDRFERWLKRTDRMTGMVHRDPIAAGAIIDALGTSPARPITVRHLLHLTNLTAEAFEHLASRALRHRDDAAFARAYEQNGLDRELTAIRAEVARTGITEAGALLMTIAK